MKSLRVLAQSILAFTICVALASCGGGTKPVTPVSPPTITSTVLPQATVNVAYAFILQATGGSGTYTWGTSSGTLPPGLSLSPQTATISGTPTTMGTYNFTATVTDGAGRIGTANLSIVVEGAILINCSTCSNGTTLPYANPGVPYSQTLTASGGQSPYIWCAVESNGSCDNGSGGALPAGLTVNTDSNGNGVISGTPTSQPAAPVQFTLQVADSETIPSHGSITLNLTILGYAPTTLANGFLDTQYHETIAVLGGLAPYTFTIGSGSLPAGLSLGNCIKTPTPNCSITGTPTATGTSLFTMQISDGENPPAMVNAQYSITVNPTVTNENFKGSYVFTFLGYNNSNLVMMAGSIAADGNGNITTGELDLNNGTGETNVACSGGASTGPQPQTIQTGSVYAIGGTGTGTMTLLTNLGTYSFNIAVRSDGTGSIIQENTDPATRGSGTIIAQSPGIDMSDIEGDFAVGVVGADPSGNRYSAAGQYALTNPNGDLSPNGFDVDDGGTVSQPTWRGTLSTTLDSFGRGCFANFSFGQAQLYIYSYYIVNRNQLVIISTDPAGGTSNANLTLWSTLRQQTSSGGFNNANLAKVVIGVSGRDTNGAPDVTTGLFVAQGNSNHTCENNNYDPATFTYDENQGGTMSGQQTTTGTYCVSNTTARVTLSGFSGVWQDPPVFYITGSNPGFIVGTDPAASGGMLVPQTGGPFTNASLDGTYAGGSYDPVISGITDSVATLFANGSGAITGVQYTSAPGGPGGPTNLSLTYTIDSTGRAVVQQNGNTFGILYAISPTQFFIVPTGTDPVLNMYATVPTT